MATVEECRAALRKLAEQFVFALGDGLLAHFELEARFRFCQIRLELGHGQLIVVPIDLKDKFILGEAAARCKLGMNIDKLAAYA